MLLPIQTILSGKDGAIVSVNCQFTFLIGMLVSSPARAEAFLGFCFTSKTRGKKGACSCMPAGFLMGINF